MLFNELYVVKGIEQWIKYNQLKSIMLKCSNCLKLIRVFTNNTHYHLCAGVMCTLFNKKFYENLSLFIALKAFEMLVP